MIAIRYVQPCSPTQILVMSSCQSWRGRSTRKKPGRFLRSNGRRRWIRLCSRITLSTRLGLTATPSRRRTNRRPSGTRRSDCRAPPRQSPARLDRGSGAARAPFSASASDTTPADSPAARAPHSPTDTPRRPDGATGRYARSLPAANAFPAISSSYVSGPSARSSSATFRRNSRSPWRSSFPASCLRAAALKQLLPPRVKERLGDRVLPADVPDAAIAAQPGQHDLDLLLRRAAPILPLLAQPIFSSGRATHAEPDAGQSLRRYAPPGPSDQPTQLALNTPTGSRAVGPLPPAHLIAGSGYTSNTRGAFAPSGPGSSGFPLLIGS